MVKIFKKCFRFLGAVLAWFLFSVALSTVICSTVRYITLRLYPMETELMGFIAVALFFAIWWRLK